MNDEWKIISAELCGVDPDADDNTHWFVAHYADGSEGYVGAIVNDDDVVWLDQCGERITTDAIIWNLETYCELPS